MSTKARLRGHEEITCVRRIHITAVHNNNCKGDVTIRGYFGIGVFHGKTDENIGTLLRSAYQLGAAFVFTVGKRYAQQSTDTTKAWRHIPLYHYADWFDFVDHIPYNCPVVAVEIGGIDLSRFWHPEHCVYLLGAEDHGIPADIIARCNGNIALDAERVLSFNVAVAGSLVMYDRFCKQRSNNDVSIRLT